MDSPDSSWHPANRSAKRRAGAGKRGNSTVPNQSQIAAAFIAACRDELFALKPGNVHVFSGGHGMEAADFIRSAEVAAEAIAGPGRVGERILAAVEATRAAVGQNTNLGIILLCAPLAVAAERQGDLRHNLAAVLAELDLADADAAFRAITLASPGGLGEAARHDVRAPARVTLLAAMQEAAERDQIAAQYANNYADIFAVGLPTLHRAKTRWAEPEWAILAVYLAFLAAFPDSHILRKSGLEMAQAVQRRAVAMAARLDQTSKPELLLPELLSWDRELKSAKLNPGTSADLTVATLFANLLIETQQAA